MAYHQIYEKSNATGATTFLEYQLVHLGFVRFVLFNLVRQCEVLQMIVCRFFFGYDIVCPSSICSFIWGIWHLQTLFHRHKLVNLADFIMTEWTGNILFQKHVVLTNLDIYICINLLRDRPFNLEGGYGFLFRSEMFFRTTPELEIFFLSRKARIFFQNLTLGYMTKILNQIIFFFLLQNQNIFFSNIGN